MPPKKQPAKKSTKRKIQSSGSENEEERAWDPKLNDESDYDDYDIDEK